jgi:hypothetical protein
MTTALLKTKWFLPLFSVALGALCLVAFWIGGNLDDGVFSLALMTAVGALFLLGGRSETIRGLRGDGRDERWQRIDIHATAVAGNVAIGAIIAMCLWEWGHGRSGSPYTALGAIAGVAYIVAVAFMRWRG